MQTIYLAGGCFWGLQKYMDQFDGVLATEVGYANGPEPAEGQAAKGQAAAAPTYQDVCANSGHAETVKIDFDPQQLPLEKLLSLYFEVIDPLSVNRQGHDRGIQYRTGIYYTDEAQLPAIRQFLAAQQQKIGQPLAVTAEPLRNYYPAEEYHQKYLDKNPGGYCHIPSSFFGK